MNLWVVVTMICAALLGWLLGATSMKLQQSYDSAASKIGGIVGIAIVSSVTGSAVTIGLAWLFTGTRPHPWIILAVFSVLNGAAALRRILRTAAWGNYYPC